MTPAVGTCLGPYELLALLGAGGMGQVYRARDTRLEREVAVKVLHPNFSQDPERLRRFEQEARAAGALNHPNLLAIYDFGTQEGSPYIVSELLEGETLRARLGGGAVPLRKGLDYAVQIAAGLAAAHQKGIGHRDLKPENLFLTQDGRVKILDFGLAKLTEPSYGSEHETNVPTASILTEPGVVMGTVGYMSPEQVLGRPADHRADIFSFGVILYEMLSGQRAFRRNSAVETMNAVLKEEPPELTETNPNFSAGVDRVIRHCLEKNPEERFQSARDLGFDLRALSEEAIQRRPAPVLTGRQPRRPTGAVLGFMLLAALILFAGRRTFFAPPPSLPTLRQLTFRLGTVSGARFAPDGQTIIYSAGWYGKPSELFTTRGDGPESRPLGFGSSGLLAVSSAGELAITMGCELNWASCWGTLARVPLSGGAPRQVLEDVYYADWSPDGKALAVVRAVQGRVRLEFPIGKVLYDTAGWITYPRVSPKGDMVAFLDHPRLGTNVGSVAVVDLAGKKRTLSREETASYGLAWHPVTGEIWFTAARSGSANAVALYGVTLAGRERLIYSAPGELLLHDISRDGRLLLDRTSSRSRIILLRSGDAEQDRDLSWFAWSVAADLSADAKTLLFYEFGRAVSTPAVYVRKTDDSDAIRLGEGRALALSPDGKWALAKQGTTPQQLVLLPTGPGEQRALPRAGIVDYASAVWFPDGKRVLLVGEESDGVPRSYVQDVNGGEPERVAREGMLAVLVSPDGKRLAGYGGDQGFYLHSLDSQKTDPIPGLENGDALVQWSADGRSLFARPAGNLPVRIFRVDLATGRRELWKQFRPPEAAGSLGVGPDQKGVLLTRDGKSLVYTHWSLLNELYLVEGLR